MSAEFADDDLAAFTDYFNLVDDLVNELGTPEKVELDLAWIMMTAHLRPEIEVGYWRFD